MTFPYYTLILSVVILNIRIKKGAEKYMKEHGIKNPRQIESKT
jgi:hypothetical protein